MALRILLVDDELNVLKSLKRVLVRSGYDVMTASSGFEALEILAANQVEIIITDFRMPEMSGADLLRQVKINWPDCVNLVLSGYADFKSVVELLNQGLVFRFLEKPWVDSELLENISEAKVKYEQRRAKRVRDQLLMGSMSGLIEIDNNGIINRFNAPAAEIIPDIHLYENKHLAYLDTAQNKAVSQSFIDKQSSTLFINYARASDLAKSEEVMIERCLNDDAFQLLKLSINSNSLSSIFQLTRTPSVVTNESDFYHHLALCEANKECYALVYIGISQFQLINDLLGGEDGSHLIKLVLEVLKGVSERAIKVLHKSADRFVLFVPEIKSDSEILTVLNKAMNDLKKALPSKYTDAHVQLYGVYGLFPEDSLEGKELVNQMQLTMNYQVGDQQRICSRFDPQLVADYKKNFELSRLLLTAVNKDELSLRFQPKIDTKTGLVLSAEVLIRWYEPTKYGWVPPAHFIPIAECDGQIISIGRWVISQSCKILKYWGDNNIGVNVLAVNISARQLKDDPDWIDYMNECLSRNNLEPSQLIFELTETYLIEDFAICEQQLIRLRTLGFKLLIDDFGVGYSSLGYLSKLPVDGVKLDKALITDIESSLAMQSMIRNITRMSHDLSLIVIAEGVETAFECEMIKKLGCDYIQGYYFSEPLEQDDFCNYLNHFNSQGAQ
ncbi:EAL domain-containing protein [Pseudoalteromonas sp. APC 3356]|uniref:EAL domain-containing response regulator n=1 Tax=unclassified Pseudoalteromonas TaxID=194690 RepID=UPI0002FF1B18|nr:MULTISPECIES: EAL domain-containing protein [unclassified Pseudoalteromonas]MDN3434856.1 EAL domain-containing protein [Pseudoalteromonas sp. APC 3356]